MIDGLIQTTTIPVLEQVLNFAQSRHAVLAGNVANMDTPGYRVRDLSPQVFQARLRRAVEQRHTEGPASGLPPGTAIWREPALEQADRSFEGILFHDDSNDSLEYQVAEIAKNQAQHNLALAILGSQFRLLQAAISERA